MGKRRILKKQGSGVDSGKRDRALSKTSKRKLDRAILFIESSYNNTRVSLADTDGGTVMWASSGSMGFTGNRKSTPFAAAKVGEVIGEKASVIGVKEVDVFIKSQKHFARKKWVINIIRNLRCWSGIALDLRIMI